MEQHNKEQIDETLFKVFLKSNGLSYTYERKLILREILQYTKACFHFSVDTIYKQMRNKGNHVSKGTLYSTLRLLENSNIIRKTDIALNNYIYERTQQHNTGHFICLKCSKIIDINQKTVKSLIDKICGKDGVKIKSHTFEIKGICLDCLT